MFTVKIINPDGEEIIKEAKSVIYHPALHEGDVNQLWLYSVREGEPPETITLGTIYVMNENGKTVANYAPAMIK